MSPVAPMAGYCSVVYNENIGEMKGHYYLLPPFQAETLNASHGCIVFTRLPEDAPVAPPSPEEIATVTTKLRKG